MLKYKPESGGGCSSWQSDAATGGIKGQGVIFFVNQGNPADKAVSGRNKIQPLAGLDEITL